MAVAALVLGILGTLLSIIPFLFWLGIPLALIALILGIVARKNAVTAQQPTGMSTAGMVLGAIGLTLGILMYVLCSVAAHKVQQMANDPTFQKQNQEFNEAFKKALEESQKQQQGKEAPGEAAPASGAPATPTTPAPAAPAAKPAPAAPTAKPAPKK